VSPVLVAALAAVVAAGVGLLAGWSEFSVTPSGAGANPLLWGLPAAALLAGTLALAVRGKPAGPISGLAAVALLAGWGLLRLTALLRPVLPSELPDVVDRASVALALGASVGAAVLIVTSGALALPSLDEEPESERR
jgi:hypothetical protein